MIACGWAITIDSHASPAHRCSPRHAFHRRYPLTARRIARRRSSLTSACTRSTFSAVFALIFMILVHFHQLMRLESKGWQSLIGWGIWLGVEEKAWGTFALLFGAGLALLMRRLEARGARVVPILVRRLTALFVIGWLVESVIGFHILTTYAVCGLLVLAMRRWSTRALARWWWSPRCSRPS